MIKFNIEDAIGNAIIESLEKNYNIEYIPLTKLYSYIRAVLNDFKINNIEYFFDNERDTYFELYGSISKICEIDGENICIKDKDVEKLKNKYRSNISLDLLQRFIKYSFVLKKEK